MPSLVVYMSLMFLCDLDFSCKHQAQMDVKEDLPMSAQQLHAMSWMWVVQIVAIRLLWMMRVLNMRYLLFCKLIIGLVCSLCSFILFTIIYEPIFFSMKYLHVCRIYVIRMICECSDTSVSDIELWAFSIVPMHASHSINTCEKLTGA